MAEPYYADDLVTLHHGKFEDVLPTLDVTADLIVTDPPYGETSLAWDRWPKGWPSVAAEYSRSMWCFGSMRMFLDQRDEFAGWRLSQDVIWDKGDGSCLSGDRFMRVHEHALHWYSGAWSEVHHEQQRLAHYGRRQDSKRGAISPHVYGAAGAVDYQDDGKRLMQTVIRGANLRGKCLNPTEKPTGLLEPLIAYGCPPGGLVLDLFAGSTSTLIAARNTGRRAIGIEMREEQCEQAARRLAQDTLFGAVEPEETSA